MVEVTTGIDVEAARRDAIASMDFDALTTAFERIGRLAQAVSGAAVARVALIHGDKIWRCGVGRSVPTLVDRADVSVLERVTAASVWIADVREDPTTREDPFIRDRPHIRFFASSPVVLANGVQIGSVYVLDATPRPYDAMVAESLADLAGLVAHECERSQLEKKAAEAEAEARSKAEMALSIIEGSPQSIALTDQDLRLLVVSPAWRTLTGMGDADVIGRSLYEVFPNAHERMAPLHERALAGEQVLVSRMQLTLPNGSRPWVRGVITRWNTPSGEPGGLVIVSHDITDMVELLDESERAKKRLTLATEIAGLNVWEVDFVQGTVRTEGDDIGLYDVEPSLDQVMADPFCGVHPEDVPEAIAAWRRFEATGEPYRVEQRVRRADGKEAWAFAGVEPIKDDEGRLTGLLGVRQNITARKETERILAQARDAAEMANRAKSEFLANMSHEIRTPLNGVMGIASALARTPMNADQRELVGLIEASAETLDNLLSDVLDLARIEAGRLSLSREPFTLESAVLPVAALFRNTAEEKGLAFEVSLPAGPQRRLLGDVVRIRQVLSNLVSNAVKFTATGAVRIAVACEDLSESGRLTISVQDTGIGFDAETRDRLFGRFAQADATITRRFGGTGLGLSISRSLAQLMGGELDAEAEPGVGATFKLTLETPFAPAGAEPSGGEAVTATIAPEIDRPMRVLLAEDHPTNRRVVEVVMESIGVDVISVENGQEALDHHASEAFDLILMDMQMPVMDGLTAIRRIRAREAGGQAPRTPIFALTANAMPEDQAASREAGADAHLIKPITASALIHAVTQVAERLSPNV